MTATIMDGRKVADSVKKNVQQSVQKLQANGIRVHLSTILVGDNPASALYLSIKQKTAKEVGIESDNHKVARDTGQEQLLRLIRRLNGDKPVNGILLQLPLPDGFIEEEAVAAIAPEKDVDGLTPVSMGLLSYGQASLIPCTPKGVMVLLHHYKITLKGKHVVIVNRSNLVGKPLAHLMLQRDATVTVCHSKTKDLEAKCREADVLVSAVGRRESFTVTDRMVKEGAVVVDVGISKVGDKIVGDVEFESVSPVVSYITPVPGGVGPMTVAMLLENTVIAASQQAGVPYSASPW